MKKTLVITLTLLMAFLLIGCAKEITGSCTTVVRECQDIPTNEQPTVTVSGYPVMVALKSGEKVDYIKLSDDGHPGGCYVNVSLKTETEIYGGRITVKGKLYPNITQSNCVTILQAEVVK